MRGMLLAGSSAVAVSVATLSGIPTNAEAACVALGGNQFEITAGAGMDLDNGCAGSADGAVATVTGNQTNQIRDFTSSPENWTLIVNPGVSLANTANVPAIFSADANFTLTNNGAIHGASVPAVRVQGAGTTTSMTITNRGVIDSLNNFAGGADSSALLIDTPSSVGSSMRAPGRSSVEVEV